MSVVQKLVYLALLLNILSICFNESTSYVVNLEAPQMRFSQISLSDSLGLCPIYNGFQSTCKGCTNCPDGSTCNQCMSGALSLPSSQGWCPIYFGQLVGCSGCQWCPDGSLCNMCPPSMFPTTIPTTYTPTMKPTQQPSFIPTLTPTAEPTVIPTLSPSQTPSNRPSHYPSAHPSKLPTSIPTFNPTSSAPTTYSPSQIPSTEPSYNPSITPTLIPSHFPTAVPTCTPTVRPSTAPSPTPSSIPSFVPSELPSKSPSAKPSNHPTITPTVKPSRGPSISPSYTPTRIPSQSPTIVPTTGLCPKYNHTHVFCSGCQWCPDGSLCNQCLDKVGRCPLFGGYYSLCVGCETCPDGSTCNRCPSMSPTLEPTLNPMDSHYPTAVPSLPRPTKTPTKIPSKSPTQKPSRKPSNSPSTTVSPSNGICPIGASHEVVYCSNCEYCPDGSLCNMCIPTVIPTAAPTTATPSHVPTSSKPTLTPSTHSPIHTARPIISMFPSTNPTASPIPHINSSITIPSLTPVSGSSASISSVLFGNQLNTIIVSVCISVAMICIVCCCFWKYCVDYDSKEDPDWKGGDDFEEHDDDDTRKSKFGLPSSVKFVSEDDFAVEYVAQGQNTSSSPVGGSTSGSRNSFGGNGDGDLTRLRGPSFFGARAPDLFASRHLKDVQVTDLSVTSPNGICNGLENRMRRASSAFGMSSASYIEGGMSFGMGVGPGLDGETCEHDVSTESHCSISIHNETL